MSISHEISRRQFLAQSAALAAASALPITACAADSIRTRHIPGTDETLPLVGLGAPSMFSNLPPEGKELPKSIIQAMVDKGGRMIDTPAWFRPNVPVLGELLTEMDLQDELFLVGKITVSGKEEGISHLEKTVQNLNKHPMDLLMVHNMRDMDNHWPTLNDWKDAGKVRYLGVSVTRNLGPARNDPVEYSALEAFMKKEKPDFIMLGYSIFHPLAAERILPLAADIGTAVIIAEPFRAHNDGGVFGVVASQPLPEWAAEFDCESWAQFSLKFALSHPAVTCAVTETSKVSHIIDNMGAGFGRLPDEATRKRMSEHLLSL